MFAICHGMLRVIPFWAIPFALVCQSAHGLEVESYYGKYDVKQKDIRGASKSLDGPHAETWPSAPKPKRAYKIGVLFPHLKDPYWLAVNFGIIERAKETGVTIKLLEAGGYRRLGDQRRQLTSDLIKDKVDGIILAAISYDKFDKPVEEVDGKGIPVVEVINDIRASSIRAKALVSFFDMGNKAGQYVRKDSEGKDITVAFFPGPKGSGWAPDTLLGFQQAFEGSKGAKGKLKLLPAQYGDTGYKMQRNLISYILKRYKKIDYLVGNAVAADAAVDVLKEYRADHPTAKIVSTYIIPDVYEKISQGKIAAAPTDLTVDQGRMSVDMMIRILNGEKPGDKASRFPFRSGPVIQVVTLKNLADFTYGRLFGPKGFSPIFKYEP